MSHFSYFFIVATYIICALGVWWDDRCAKQHTSRCHGCRVCHIWSMQEAH